MTICFTGPRPSNLHDYSESSRPLYQRIVDITAAYVGAFVEQHSATRFISGGAQGFDQLAFWAVNHVRDNHPEIENLVYIPFKNQPNIWRATGLFSQHEYSSMLRHMTGYKIISENPPRGDKKAAARALFARNHAMVADSDVVIALLSGRSLDYQTAAGGTAECVRYALRQNKPVFAIRYQPNLPADQQFSAGWL